MSQLYYDALFCMTFMVVLLAMVRVRKTVFKGDKDAFVKMIIGVSFLTGFSILQLLGNQQVFAGQVNSSGERIHSILSPNIFYDGVSIHFEKQYFKRYSIYNLQGQVIEQGSIGGKEQIKLQHLQSGLYVLHLIGEKGVISRKIMK